MNVAVIPARGGSKRIPHKNRRLFHVKPIIAYSIETARESGLFSRIVVSTEDAEIAAIAESYGAMALHRSIDLCADHYGPLDICGKVLFDLAYRPDVRPYYACCICATAPLMIAYDLRRGYNLLLAQTHMDFAFSVGHVPFLHDAAQFYWGKPAAFILGKQIFAEHSIMIPIAPERDCDINTENDWLRAEKMYKELNP